MSQRVRCLAEPQVKCVNTVAPHGGGGTAFRPVFNWIVGSDIQPICAVYLTDLYGSDFGPVLEYPVLWVSTGADTAPFGEVIAYRCTTNANVKSPGQARTLLNRPAHLELLYVALPCARIHNGGAFPSSGRNHTRDFSFPVKRSCASRIPGKISACQEVEHALA